MNKVIYSILVMMMVVIGSCDDFLETDISASSVILTAPRDSVQLSDGDVTFQWEHINGSYGYLLQIAYPTFERAEKIVLDTFIVENRLMHSLDSGWYEWRVSAENGAYYSPFSKSSFYVKEVLDNASSVSLKMPENGRRTRLESNKIIFSWEDVDDASEYLFKVRGDTTITQTTDQTSLTINLPNSGDFTWQVIAFLPNSEIAESEIRSLEVDKTAPTIVVLNNPTDGTELIEGSEIVFNWNESGDEDFEKYQFRLYNADSGEDILVEEYLSNLLNNTFTISEVANGSLPVGAYAWEVVSIDDLGNYVDTDLNRYRFTVKAQ